MSDEDRSHNEVVYEKAALGHDLALGVFDTFADRIGGIPSSYRDEWEEIREQYPGVMGEMAPDDFEGRDNRDIYERTRSVYDDSSDLWLELLSEHDVGVREEEPAGRPGHHRFEPVGPYEPAEEPEEAPGEEPEPEGEPGPEEEPGPGPEPEEGPAPGEEPDEEPEPAPGGEPGAPSGELQLINLNRGRGEEQYEELLQNADPEERERIEAESFLEYRDNFSEGSIFSFLDTGEIHGSYALRVPERIRDDVASIRIEGGVPDYAYRFPDGTRHAFYDDGPGVYEQAVDEIEENGQFVYELDGLPLDEAGDHWYRAKVLDEDGEVLAETRHDGQDEWTTWDVSTTGIWSLWHQAKESWSLWNGGNDRINLLVGRDTGTAHYDADEPGGPFYQARQQQFERYKKASPYSKESDFWTDIKAHGLVEAGKALLGRE